MAQRVAGQVHEQHRRGFQVDAAQAGLQHRVTRGSPGFLRGDQDQPHRVQHELPGQEPAAEPVNPAAHRPDDGLGRIRGDAPQEPLRERRGQVI